MDGRAVTEQVATIQDLATDPRQCIDRVFVPVESFTPSAKAAYQRDRSSDGQIQTIQKLVEWRDYSGDRAKRCITPYSVPCSIRVRSPICAPN